MSISDTDRTMAQALNDALREEMERDPRVFLMGEDIGHYGGVFGVTRGLFAQFGPERVRDTPISESGFIGAAIGAAAAGWRPVVEIMWIDFAMVAMDQIVNQAAKMRYMSGGQLKIPLVIRTQEGAGRGNGAQHSQSLESMFAQVPGLKVVAPSNPRDAKALLKAAIREDSPVLFIEHKLLYGFRGPVLPTDEVVPLGIASVVRPGSDVTILSLSRMVHFCLEAAQKLANMGIEAEVIDLRSVQPWDIDAVAKSVQKTGRLVIVHEAHRSFGWGAEIAATLAERGFDHLLAPIRRVCSDDVPFPYNRQLERAVMPDPQRIVTTVQELLRDYP
ncbi:MAG: alpha-ketoacid dehydrogenase subunit beta [Firmicutes bacterium]|nr:alpha-ketoacid dehydrogenase subunit beta [Bacillota bacterium]